MLRMLNLLVVLVLVPILFCSFIPVLMIGTGLAEESAKVLGTGAFILLLTSALCFQEFYDRMEAGARPGDQKFVWQAKIMCLLRFYRVSATIGALLVLGIMLLMLLY